MNWAHLRAFAWVRWRTAHNRFERGGPLGATIAALLAVVVAAVVVVSLVLGMVIGRFPLQSASPADVMGAWDVAIVVFVVMWFAGLMAELQQADALSLDRFLHLPVSPSSAFVINYLGTSISPSLVLLMPFMTGLALGLASTHGPFMLLLLPLVAAFFLMMTALAYQFRAWLASVMANPRRRRTIIAVLPMLFIIAVQAPNLMRTFGNTARDRRRPQAVRIVERDYAFARTMNMMVPPGWLAFGAEGAARHNAWPPLAGLLGMTLVGALSLRRSYNTTLRLYRGDFDRVRQPASPPSRTAVAARSERVAATFMERRLPWISEPVAAVALANFRTWLRAPEMKLTVLSPVIMLAAFSRIFLSNRGVTGPLLPLTTAGLMGFVLLFGMTSFIGNQFGFDRAGFRAFVLGPMRRRDLLVGKNLSVLPFAAVMVTIVVGVSQWFRPLRADQLAGVLLQAVPIYLLLCLVGNQIAILCPLTLKPSSGRPVPQQAGRGLGHFVGFFAGAFAVGLTFIPFGVEALLSYFDRLTWLPVSLVLSAAQAAVAIPVYRALVVWQGTLLQQREQRVLEIVAARSE